MVPAAERDEPLIGSEALRGVALRADPQRASAVIRRGRVPHPGDRYHDQVDAAEFAADRPHRGGADQFDATATAHACRSLT
jgi:hypothetical protein